MRCPEILERLESHYGPQEPSWPTDPYRFLVWWHCGYPASEKACARGWASLEAEIGIDAHNLLAATAPQLAAALRPGGMVPELRAQRLKEIATRVVNEFGGDLGGGLAGPLQKLRQSLKRFPNIADPGADRIVLFAHIAPIPAVPSNCPHVLVRIRRGEERENYGVTYREAQQAIESEVAENCAARQRAFLLLQRHGQEVCKRTKPRCEGCCVRDVCQYAAGKKRGRATDLR